MTIIEQIKAEIERLKSIEYPCDNSQQATGFFNAIDRMTDFLDTLESEKPMVLEEEISRYLREECSDDDEPSIREIALHFYDFGCRRTAEKYDEIEYNRQRAEESVPKDLKEAAKNIARDVCKQLPNGEEKDGIVYYAVLAAIEGAKWQKEQMMKEAIDGEVDAEYFGYKVIRPDLKQLDTLLESMNHGEKVRVIICKKEN